MPDVRVGLLLTWCLVGCGAEIGGDDPSADARPRADGSAETDDAGSSLPDAARPEPQTTVFAVPDVIDTYLRLKDPTFNYGVAASMCADTTTDDRRMLLRIDVSSVPAAAEIVAANLHLWTGTSTNDLSTQTYSIYRMLESWNEGGQNAAAGAASWNERKSGTPWTVAGAGNGSRDDVVMGTFVPTAIDTEYIISLEPELIAGWLADGESNFGIVIVAAGSDGACFDTTEYPTAGKHPTLSVTWLPL